jgi:cell wall-associated NlpC family hydrolase
MLLRVLILITCMLIVAPDGGAAQQSFGQTLKKIFSTPTPTPHRKKKSGTATAKKSPTPTPTPRPSPSPTPASKKKNSPTPTPSASSRRKKKASPTPSPTETPERSTTPTPTPEQSPSVASQTPAPSTTPKPATPKRGAPNASLSPEQIKEFENYPESVKKLLGTALELTTRNLTYKYGSDDPAAGGMDCSGFVYYVLKQNGVADVPRDSSAQYVWLRRAGRFEPVFSRKDNSFELENLKPGDLLFWTGTYSIDRDPPITHAMIYLGREKKSGRRVMVGASDGRVYQGESRYGVSVFDFQIPRPDKNGDGKLQPSFIGYGHIPAPRE